MADWNFFKPAETDPRKMSLGELFQTCGDGRCLHCYYKDSEESDGLSKKQSKLKATIENFQASTDVMGHKRC